MAADGEEDDQREHEVQVADERALGAELRVEHLADVEPHLLADHLAGPLGGDEHEAHDHAHGQPEDHLAADADRQFPDESGQRHGRHGAADAQRQHQHQQHAHAPRDAGAAEQRRVQHHPGQPEEDQDEHGHALEQVERHGQ